MFVFRAQAWHSLNFKMAANIDKMFRIICYQGCCLNKPLRKLALRDIDVRL
jgi:hypothetical protein